MLALKTIGNPFHPSLIFLHGFLGTKEDWEPLIHHLQSSFFCIAIDLPGHGASSFTTDWNKALFLTLATLPALVDPTLVGYSMGGRFALHYPHKIRRILLSTHLGLTSSKEKEARWAQDLLWASRLQNLPLSAFYTLWYQQPLFQSLQTRQDLMPHLLQRPHRNPSLLAQALLHRSLAKQEKISLPFSSLFLCGEKDEKFVNLYRNEPEFFEYEIIPLTGHILHLENPKACAQAILKFCQRPPS